MKYAEFIRKWWTSYVEKGATPDQLKFWFLFWGSVVTACALYYVYDRRLSEFLSLEVTSRLNLLVAYGCFLLPAFVLRRLHVVILIVIILKLLDLLH
ncbi:hypothetical protein ACFPMF_21775 [Larkinella bovis]|uniref:Uncharacterized protein n=1 Tax=Larkinella bovis TaxID=683041 RepID=A0ABW0IGV3_9BACT